MTNFWDSRHWWLHDKYSSSIPHLRLWLLTKIRNERWHWNAYMYYMFTMLLGCESHEKLMTGKPGEEREVDVIEHRCSAGTVLLRTEAGLIFSRIFFSLFILYSPPFIIQALSPVCATNLPNKRKIKPADERKRWGVTSLWISGSLHCDAAVITEVHYCKKTLYFIQYLHVVLYCFICIRSITSESS